WPSRSCSMGGSWFPGSLGRCPSRAQPHRSRPGYRSSSYGDPRPDLLSNGSGRRPVREPDRKELRQALEDTCRAASRARGLLDRLLVYAEPLGAPAALQSHVSEPGRLLTTEVVAERLGVPVRWVYRQARKWPFTRKLGHRTLRFESSGFEKFLRTR